MKNISVLIPTYKPKEYIQKCFKSLETQTLNKKLFCVYVCLNGKKEPYEKYILNLLSNISFNYKYLYEKKQGVSNARNKLLEISRENFVIFLDDDDIISNNYLENLLNIASKKYIGISNIYNFYNSIENLKQNYIGKTFCNIKDGEKSKFKTRKYYSSPWAKIIHKDIIDSIFFDTKLSKGEDALFMATISKNIIGVKKTTNDTIYYVNERAGSITRQKVNLFIEIQRTLYTLRKYFSLFLDANYDKLFILTRLIATFKNLFNIIKESFKNE